MKKLLFGLTIILSFLVSAQEQQSLIVDYQIEMQLDEEQVINNIPAQFRSQVEDAIRAEIKNGIKIDYQLKTNGNLSVYTMQKKLDNSQSQSGMIAQQIMQQDAEPLYKEIGKRKFYKKYQIMTDAYVINDSLPNYQWTITREKAQIAGFDVRKANGVYNDSITVEAWFAPKLKFKDGPDRLWGLPGLVLKSVANIGGTKATTLATNVAVKEEVIRINPPKAKKYYSEEEFQKEMVAFQKRMKEMYGGGVDDE